MNRVCLVGRLTSKPELRTVGSGLATTRFTLAVNRTFSNSQGEREADFITIVAWRKQAENVCRYLDKGSLISVDGRIQTGSFEGQDGARRYTTEVIADQVNFLESKNQASRSRNVEQVPDNGGFFSPMNESKNQDNVPSGNDVFGDFGDFGESVRIDGDFLD